MSFPRAAIRRFNDVTDNSIPPPGAYDPKFATDVGVIASTPAPAKGSILPDKWSRHNGANGKSRPEDTEPSQQYGYGKISRDTTYGRKSSTAAMNPPADATKRSDPVPSVKAPIRSRSRLRSRSSSSCTAAKSCNNNSTTKKSPSVSFRPPSTSSTASTTMTIEDVEDREERHGETEQDLDSEETNKSLLINLHLRHDCEGMSCQAIIDEIQGMAQTLQVEVTEYKRRLSTEIIRCKELEAKKLELEYTIHSLSREMKKYELSKATLEETGKDYHAKIAGLNMKIRELEQQVSDLQEKCEAYKKSEEILMEKVAKLEEEKAALQTENLGNEKSLNELHTAIQMEENKRLEVEAKYAELVSQMDSCFNSCESKTEDMEVLRETFEVKLQEANQQKDDLIEQLNSAKRALETQQTLMDLMKMEEKEREMGRQDDYIS